MKSGLKRNKKTLKYLEKLPKIYVVACWAKYGVVYNLRFSGRYVKGKQNEDIPLVWQYDDKNGTVDNYYLRPITLVTTGLIKLWTPYKDIAEDVAYLYNHYIIWR